MGLCKDKRFHLQRAEDLKISHSMKLHTKSEKDSLFFLAKNQCCVSAIFFVLFIKKPFCHCKVALNLAAGLYQGFESESKVRYAKYFHNGRIFVLKGCIF